MFNTASNESRYATNTLTNIAPKYGEFNHNTWVKMEEGLLVTVKEHCTFPGAKFFVIVGVEPSIKIFTERKIREKYVEGVNLPKFYWTAVCYDTSTTASTDDHQKGWSFAYKADIINKKSVTVNFDPVNKLLPNKYFNIFADHTLANGDKIIGCQFSKEATKTIITDMIKKDRNCTNI